MLAALILEVMDRCEYNALKVSLSLLSTFVFYKMPVASLVPRVDEKIGECSHALPVGEVRVERLPALKYSRYSIQTL